MIAVEAGQIYSAPGKNGPRYVKVDSVRRGAPPYRARVVECGKSGGTLRKARDGFKKDLVFSITLTTDTRGNYILPAPYTLETP